MPVFKFTQEIRVRVSAKKMFKVYAVETNEVLPKIVPNAIKSIEILEGNGGVGTLRQIKFAEGLPFPYSKHRIDELDVDNCVLRYTLVEGSVLGGHLELVHYDQKYEDAPDGGCIIEIVREVHVKDVAGFNEDGVKAEEENYLRITNHVEEYLLAHPEVCA